MSTRAHETSIHALSPALVETFEVLPVAPGADEFVIASRSETRSSSVGSFGAADFVSCAHPKLAMLSSAAQAATASNPIFRTPAMPAIIASSLCGPSPVHSSARTSWRKVTKVSVQSQGVCHWRNYG